MQLFKRYVISVICSVAGLLSVVALVSDRPSAATSAAAGEAAAASCASLKNLSLPNVTITSATEKTEPFVTTAVTNSAATFTVPGPFPFCLVEATLSPSGDSVIKAEVWLPWPDKWNGKFVGLGNGGLTGGIRHASMVRPLWSGFAVTNSDLGHPGSNPNFAYGHHEKLIDYAHRADHVTAQMAKAVVDAYYGVGPRLSYFHGCSNGGHQALMEVQRYPDDYDGVIAGAPWNQWTHQIVEFISRTIQLENIDSTKLPMITKAVVSQCARVDSGLATDGYLNDPRLCNFKPKTLQCTGTNGPGCLTVQEVAAVERIYQGPVQQRTGRSLYPGFELGSEFNWSGLGTFTNDLFRNIVYETDPTWDYHKFDFGSDVAFFDTKLAGLLNSNDPDLGPFQAHGGKLVMFHGWNDTTLEPHNTVNYYNAITAVTAAGLNLDQLRQLRDEGDNRSQRRRRRALTETQEFARLFMLPGVDHCRGGIGPNDIGQTGTPDAHVGPGFPPIDSDYDLLTALDRWVDRGLAPDVLIASHITNGVLDRTRPICAYPQIARYNGRGDKNSARNFSCVNEWDGFDRDFSRALNNLISNVRLGDFTNIPN